MICGILAYTFLLSSFSSKCSLTVLVVRHQNIRCQYIWPVFVHKHWSCLLTTPNSLLFLSWADTSSRQEDERIWLHVKISYSFLDLSQLKLLRLHVPHRDGRYFSPLVRRSVWQLCAPRWKAGREKCAEL